MGGAGDFDAMRLKDMVLPCMVQVISDSATSTGFFVAVGKVLTCRHTIGDVHGVRVRWGGHELNVHGSPITLPTKGRLVPDLAGDYPDIVVLDVAHPYGLLWMPLDVDRPRRDDAFQAFGYPDEGDTSDLALARLICRDSEATAPTAYLDLAGDAIHPGLGGGPVLNLRTGGVCAVVVASQHPDNADGTLAVSCNTIAADLADVLAANRSLSRYDRAWRESVRVAAAAERTLQQQEAPGSINGSQGVQTGSENVQNNQFGPIIVWAGRDAYTADTIIINQSERAPGKPIPAPSLTLTIEAGLPEPTRLDSRVAVNGAVLSNSSAALSWEVTDVWAAFKQPGPVASEWMADAGRKLAGALLDVAAQQDLAARFRQLPLGVTAEVVLIASGPALSLPVELLRLAGDDTPLGLRPGVAVSRRPGPVPPGPGDNATVPAPLPGPLKVLVAVAAPDETKTQNEPLDAEAEMAAVLASVFDVASNSNAQVRILEVASLTAIQQALQSDDYHVLHLVAHGTPGSVELEDEDGSPVTVTTEALVGMLKHVGRPLPLIVLSSCSTAAAGSASMAAALLAHGADRVVAMLAPVTEDYAITLASHFYRELATGGQATTVGLALTRARRDTEETQSGDASDWATRPQYGVATLFNSRSDVPLVDPEATARPLTTWTTPPTGRGVRELPLNWLIGRRPQLRDVMGMLRRTERAVSRFGASSGVVLTGMGGIGKTAVAGRAVSRLRDEGWLICIHQGRWNPAALISATAEAVDDALLRVSDPALSRCLARLTDPKVREEYKLELVIQLLGTHRLLLVFDDFEQNLTAGGGAFLSPDLSDLITRLADAASAGALLITCRYPLPGDDRFLARVDLPPLSGAELHRMFLRLPALCNLSPADKHLLMQTIGGHPRLIEFADAIRRGGRSDFTHVQVKLRDLARKKGLSLAPGAPLQAAMNQAMILGSADIYLGELLTLLTPSQTAALHQIAICRGAIALDDLAFALNRAEREPAAPDLAALETDVNRLIDLTLLTPGPEIRMHLWTAELVCRNATSDLALLHERALSMRYRRVRQERWVLDDRIEIPRHMAALGRHDDIVPYVIESMFSLGNGLMTAAYLAEALPLIPAPDPSGTFIATMQMGNLFFYAAAYYSEEDLEENLRRAKVDPRNIQAQREATVSHMKFASVTRTSGDLATASAHYQAALDIAAHLAAADPSNTEWQNNQCLIHIELGMTAALDNVAAAARAHYQAALDIAAQLATADPGNEEWQGHLFASHFMFGTWATGAGDLTTADFHLQAALSAAQRLAATYRDGTDEQAEQQKVIATVHEQLGNTAAAAGDLAAARTHYQAAFSIRRPRADDPGNIEWPHDGSVDHYRLGDAATAEGDLATARTHYQAAFCHARQLVTANPDSTEWQGDLLLSHMVLANFCLTAADDWDSARSQYEAIVGIAGRLAAAEPDNTEWQEYLFHSYFQIGGIEITGDNPIAVALPHFYLARGIALRLATADPASIEWQENLLLVHLSLGIAMTANAPAAEHYLQSALEIGQRLAAAEPDNAEWQDHLNLVHDALGHIETAASGSATEPATRPPSTPGTHRLPKDDPWL